MANRLTIFIRIRPWTVASGRHAILIDLNARIIFAKHTTAFQDQIANTAHVACHCINVKLSNIRCGQRIECGHWLVGSKYWKVTARPSGTVKQQCECSVKESVQWQRVLHGAQSNRRWMDWTQDSHSICRMKSIFCINYIPNGNYD